MLSFPRDLSHLPLWDGRTYSGKINSLMTYAQGHKKEFPDGGLPTLMKELGFLLGVPIHYYAAIDLAGFVKMVDLVGGVDDRQSAGDRRSGLRRLDERPPDRLPPDARASITSTARPRWPTSARARGSATTISPGRGASSRSSSRWARSWPTRRCCPKIPDLVRAAGDTIRTNFPPDRLGEMLDIGTGIDDVDVKRTSSVRRTRRTRPSRTATYQLDPGHGPDRQAVDQAVRRRQRLRRRRPSPSPAP